MKIELKTDDTKIEEHYLQSLVLLYMPCEKFGEGDDSSRLEFCFRTEDQSFFGFARLFYDGKSYEKELCESISSYSLAKNAQKCFCGKLFVILFSDVFGYKPPWGILTGVRPARFALEFLLDGLSEQETKELLQKYYLADEDKALLAIKVARCDLLVLKAERERQYSLYIGIPFCPSRCKYCSFVSYATPKLLSLLPDYLEMLKCEVNLLCKTADDLGLSLKSVYVGGGTPSVLSAEQIDSLLSSVRKSMGKTDCEFTFEAGRPDTVDKKKLSVLKDHLVTRLSINTQTANDEILRSVGRLHTFDDYKRAYFSAKEKGFIVNTDLIAGLPGESVESFCDSINKVCALAPDNITVHAFSLKRSSEYTVEGQRFDPGDKTVPQMISYSSDKLLSCGYSPYYMYRQKNTGGNFENIGYTKENSAMALYNIYMMEGFHSVFAAGAGASTKLVSKNLSTIGKIYNPKYPYEYLRAKDDILKNKDNILQFYNEKYDD